MNHIDLSFIKKNWKVLLATFVVSFFAGMVVDHYVLYPYFSPNNAPVEECVVNNIPSMQTSNSSVEIVDNASLDRKITYSENAQNSNTCQIYVDVSGAVKEPGVYCLENNALLIDAINKAGGFSDDVAYRFVSRKYNLAKVVGENQKIYIPHNEELECTSVKYLSQSEIVAIATNTVEDITDSSTSTFWGEASSPQEVSIASSSANTCININTASLEALQTLSGVGASTAQKIIDARPYTKVEDLLNVSGIGENTYAKFKELICV